MVCRRKDDTISQEYEVPVHNLENQVSGPLESPSYDLRQKM